MAPPFPAVFGKYILLKPLARGGMGDLYLALAGEIGGFEKLCVIKRVRAGQQAETVVRRFLDEAKVVIKLSHGNLVQVFDAGYVEDELYLAMEYVEGRDLREMFLRSQKQSLRLPIAFGLYLVNQICRALDFAHGYSKLNLVHRDICPSNVLVSYYGEVKVTDFGLATSTLKEERTEPGKIFGKFSYLSPEQARGEEVDARTDVYSTAIVLWELLAGRQLRPGPHTDAKLALREARLGRITPPSSFNREVSPELDVIAVKGLQIDREQRYPSAEALRQEVAGVLARLSPTYGSGDVAAFMRRVYGEIIQADAAEREQLTSQDYNALRRRSASGVPQLTPPPVKDGGPGSAAADLSGQLLDGRYRILRLIGEGGMGGVYEAEHVEIGRRVAIKILHAIFGSHPETVARFRAEARAATRIGHPNIVEVTDSGTTADGRVYFVMELLEGVDLAQVMAEQRVVPDRRALQITLQLCQALHAAHEAGIVHRDLKPENIFLCQRGPDEQFVKILDFGIAKNVELRGKDADRLTHPGIAMGTPEYMAPEQAAGLEVDRRIDIYATATLLFEMLTGRLPFAGENMMQMLTAKASQPPQTLRQFRPDLPEALEQVIVKALAARRGERYQTMQAMGKALLPFLQNGAGQRSATPPGWGGSPGQAIGSDPTVQVGSLAGEPSGGPSPAAAGAAAALPGGVLDLPLEQDLTGESYLPTKTVSSSRRSRRSQQLMILSVVGGAAVAGMLLALFWPRAEGGAIVAPDAAAPTLATSRPDAGARAIDAAAPRAKLTEQEVAQLLEWARRAAMGKRYSRPKGDNVIELLERIEEDYPGHPAAAALRQRIVGQLRQTVARSLRRGRFALSQSLIDAWQELAPSDERVKEAQLQLHLRQARLALERRRYKVGLQQARAARKLAPERASVEELLGDLQARRRKHALAAQHYEQALAKKELGRLQRRRLAAKLRRAKKAR